MKKLTLEDLAIDHDYYCSPNNYYSYEATLKYDTFADFYEEFHDADVDKNLIFRWDLHKREESKRYYLELFMINQRKGIFKPIYITFFDERDIDSFVKYLKPHIEKLKAIWKPFKF